jgi:23S rRNA (cytidine1920-2'-O)/16S rRNA (cytidine1409-2'-O)-methyltransferase
MSGIVYVNGQKEDKAGSFFDTSKSKIEVRGATPKYVSRGGLKLEKAMETWGFKLDGKICMDIGASTGGFTDCMLQNGAEKVYSVDVGHGQLAWKLRNDERVVVMEQTNFRFLTPADIPEKIDFASVDVSFISIDKILVPARNLLKDRGRIVALVKPQFEAGKGKVGKNGVVREQSVHEEVLSRCISFADHAGFDVLGIDFSPIKGPEGNIEYLMNLRKKESISDELLAMGEKECIESFEEAFEKGEWLSESPEWKEKIKGLASKSHTELK